MAAIAATTASGSASRSRSSATTRRRRDRAKRAALTFWHHSGEDATRDRAVAHGPALARCTRMKLASSFVLVTMLCGPALADTASAQLKLSVTSNKNVRNYDMALVEQTCGEVKHEEAKLRDEIKTCMKVHDAQMRLAVEWNLRAGDRVLPATITTLTDNH